MTTPAAAAAYLHEHLVRWRGKGYAVHNPDNLPLEQLPVILGFNNGGNDRWYEAVLISDDGVFLGSHICSHEGYMPGDLGVLEGSRPDRHETFRAHYPRGYRMDFVPWAETKAHEGLKKAIDAYNERAAANNVAAVNDGV